jgi:hypothetical protein
MALPTLTAQDLDDWSPRLDARSHLPTLIRRLIFASVRPDQVVIPDAEGTGAPGLDGILFSAAGAPPYVPVGRSAWEFKTSGDPQKELGEDYRKRTKQLSDEDRARTTIVLVTTRIWDRAKVDAWIKRREKDGWAEIRVITAEDLATWLPQCPGVLGWLEEHCGRNPYGRTALRDFWVEWSNQTEPAVPPALLLAGRAKDREHLLDVVGSTATDHVIATRTEDEAIGFVAAILLVDPETTSADDDDRTEDERAADAAADASRREALLERAIVVHDTNAWRWLASHHDSLILIPSATCEPTIDAAVAAGHHVLLPRVARPGDDSLAKLDRGEARAAWERAGVPFDVADELARAARRSLTSLRRRRGRAGHLRRPDWASGTDSTLLGPLLLAGAWDTGFAGDASVVLELSDRQTLRTLDRDLLAIASQVDPPVLQRGDGWEFLDPVDAWDQVGGVITAHDLELFAERAVEVLTYRNPNLDMSTAERLTADLNGTLPAPKYSGTLRRGFAETIAVLGAVRGDTVLPGGRTGGEWAVSIVHELVHGASASRWRELADLLPTLAEGAPSTILEAIEESLREADPAILGLFDEHADALALSTSSSHTGLLWALEHLAFSPQYLSRVVVILGQLAERDPGGKLANRPKNSLRDILHPVIPQSGADTTSRLAAIDAVRERAPAAAWELLRQLVKALNHGMILNRGPRYRDWPRAQEPTRAEVFETVTRIGERIVADVHVEPERWTQAFELITNLPPAVRTTMLSEAEALWDQLPDEVRSAIVGELRAEITKHQRYRDSAWALDAAGLAELAGFVDRHPTDEGKPGAHALFTWWPDVEGIDPDTDEGKQALQSARMNAVRALNLDGIGALGRASEVPGSVGLALAAATSDHDEDVLAWLASDDGALQAVATGLARARQQADPEWLLKAVRANEALAVSLLLTGDVTAALIDYVDAMHEQAQDDFWSKVNPWTVMADMRLTVAERLLWHDRPFSAINVLYRDDGDTFPVQLGIDAMTRPLTGTSERIEVLHSPGYMLRGMLDRLDAAGAATAELAILEWFYNPALRHERTPNAFHRMLAEDPELFAGLVALTTYPDDHSDVEPDAVGADGEQDADEKINVSVGGIWTIAGTAEDRENAFTIVRDWSLPMPGAPNGDAPDTAALQDWVDRARARLADLGRAGLAGHAIGPAISGSITDADGTWPCRAVREVLERENDRDMEQGVWLGRVNARGVTSRSPYSGGRQERTLADEYKQWADRVRDTWPRAGALLDSLSQYYEADARREDRSADKLGDR